MAGGNEDMGSQGSVANDVAKQDAGAQDSTVNIEEYCNIDCSEGNDRGKAVDVIAGMFGLLQRAESR